MPNRDGNRESSERDSRRGILSPCALVLCHGQHPRNGREWCHSQCEERYLVLRADSAAGKFSTLRQTLFFRGLVNVKLSRIARWWPLNLVPNRCSSPPTQHSCWPVRRVTRPVPLFGVLSCARMAENSLAQGAPRWLC